MPSAMHACSCMAVHVDSSMWRQACTHGISCPSDVRFYASPLPSYPQIIVVYAVNYMRMLGVGSMVAVQASGIYAWDLLASAGPTRAVRPTDHECIHAVPAVG